MSGAATRQAREETAHGIRNALLSSVDKGWYIECLCGWTSSTDSLMENGL